MAASLNEQRTTPTGAGQRADDPKADNSWSSLRDEVASMAETVRDIGERRAQALMEQADAGVFALRSTIRRYPTAALGAAAVTGALLAVVLVPKAGSSRRMSWYEGSLPASRRELYDLADSIQSSMSRAVRSASAPLTPAFTRAVDAVTSVDPKASISPVVDKVIAWLDKARAEAKSVAGTAASKQR